MSRASSSRRFANLNGRIFPPRRAWAALFLAAACLSAAHADESYHLLIEPKFMRYEAAWPIPGSQDTVLVPARVVDGEVVPLKRNDFLAPGLGREKILASARAEAAKVSARLQPRYVRDENKAIQYAVIESDDPLTASAVLAPDFAAQFATTLGPNLLVAIPSRFRVFVFPRDSQAHLPFAEYIISEYQSSPHPVSREVFEIRNGTFRAVGAYR